MGRGRWRGAGLPWGGVLLEAGGAALCPCEGGRWEEERGWEGGRGNEGDGQREAEMERGIGRKWEEGRGRGKKRRRETKIEVARDRR